jgi:hypothetical protein
MSSSVFCYLLSHSAFCRLQPFAAT